MHNAASLQAASIAGLSSSVILSDYLAALTCPPQLWSRLVYRFDLAAILQALYQ